jgi:DeoR/GlpR family transcriptional regulator of sugar metabolism
VLAESEKLQRRIPNVELAWQDISVLVTDDGIDALAKQQIEQHGVRVICASTNNIGA